MYFTDEKDYIMRMIKEMVRILFSLIYGKKYVSVELEKENKYEVSGKNLKSFLDMIDSGQINEAENILLDNIDYANNDEVMAAALFYQYLNEKDSEFLINNNYTKEEVLSGFKQLLVQSGYNNLLYMIKDDENAENPVCRIQKFNMKYEIERMEIIYTFYFFLPF